MSTSKAGEDIKKSPLSDKFKSKQLAKVIQWVVKSNLPPDVKMS